MPHNLCGKTTTAFKFTVLIKSFNAIHNCALKEFCIQRKCISKEPRNLNYIQHNKNQPNRILKRIHRKYIEPFNDQISVTFLGENSILKFSNL